MTSANGSLAAGGAAESPCAVAVQDVPVEADPGAVRRILNAFVRQFRYTELGEGWVEVSIEDAHAVVRQVLLKDLAYGVAVMPEAESWALAESFLSLFGSTARCFTNGNLVLPKADPGKIPGSWTALASATFDTGVTCFGASRVGILWVEDED